MLLSHNSSGKSVGIKRLATPLAVYLASLLILLDTHLKFGSSKRIKSGYICFEGELGKFRPGIAFQMKYNI